MNSLKLKSQTQTVTYDAIALLKQRKIEIENKMTKIFKDELDYAKSVSIPAHEMMENLREYNLREIGKRIRPTLMLYGYKCFATGKEDAILEASCCIEFLEGYLLAHDDIADRDIMRRGGKTLWKIYEDEHKQKKFKDNSYWYGTNLAILAGDVNHSLAIDALAKSDFPADLKIQAIKRLNRVNIDTCYGQQLDILNEIKKHVTEADVFKVHEKKTAKYTVEAPLHMGAVLAGANENQLKVLSDYAIPFGIAFQVQDDILGMYGDEKKLGKPADSDLKEGKRTLLTVFVLEKGSKKQKKILCNALGNRNATIEQVNAARKIIQESGSLDYSKKIAVELASKAKKAIRDANLLREGKDFLIGIADYLIKRDF